MRSAACGGRPGEVRVGGRPGEVRGGGRPGEVRGGGRPGEVRGARCMVAAAVAHVAVAHLLHLAGVRHPCPAPPGDGRLQEGVFQGQDDAMGMLMLQRAREVLVLHRRGEGGGIGPFGWWPSPSPREANQPTNQQPTDQPTSQPTYQLTNVGLIGEFS